MAGVPGPLTRAQFYARKNGGGWRVARKAFTCQQSLCLHKITPGDVYLDTCEVTTWPKTKRICHKCGTEKI